MHKIRLISFHFSLVSVSLKLNPNLKNLRRNKQINTVQIPFRFNKFTLISPHPITPFFFSSKTPFIEYLKNHWHSFSTKLLEKLSIIVQTHIYLVYILFDNIVTGTSAIDISSFEGKQLILHTIQSSQHKMARDIQSAVAVSQNVLQSIRILSNPGIC